MFADDFHAYKNRVMQYAGKFDTMTEEATKNALIMPFLVLLGYDVFDPEEIMPEYVCDVAGKKGEKIDYVILHDGEPVVLIEAKRAGLKLQKQQQGQLYRYFSTNRCRLAILTNGCTYNFFSDINAPNVMDDEPFLSFNIIEDEEELYLPSLEQFHKSVFNIKDILSKAVFLKYIKVVEQTLRQDLISPSDELVKYFLSRPEIKTGNRITTQMIDKHRQATADTMRKVMGAVISAQPNESASPEPAAILAAEPAPLGEALPPFAESSVRLLRDISDNAECRCTDISGVANIDIAINGVAMGRLRVSLKHGRARFDYTDIDGKMHFLHSADECTAYINPAIQNVTL